MKMAITKITSSEIRPIPEWQRHWDCDFTLFEPIVKQMNEMGAPVTMYDLMGLVEGKLSGRIVSGHQDPHLIYTFVVTDVEGVKIT